MIQVTPSCCSHCLFDSQVFQVNDLQDQGLVQIAEGLHQDVRVMQPFYKQKTKVQFYSV